MSRVADELGTGSSFGRARGVSARRQAVAATTGVPTAGAPDSRLRTLPLEHLVPTRFNPRRNFGTEDDLIEFGLKLKKKQLQPAVAVTRDAYLELWPEEAASLGNAHYVIANGERRYRGSRAAGLTTLEVVIDDDIAKSRADFLDAVQSENNDREDLDPIERALGIDIMVTQLGGAQQVAVYYDKTKGWVSQQRKLLKLTPALQDLVASGEMPVRVARDIAGLPAEVQETAWEEEVAKRKAAKEAAARWKTEGAPTRPAAVPPPPGPARFTAVNSGPADPAPAIQTANGQPPRFTAVNKQDDAAGQGSELAHIPQPKTDGQVQNPVLSPPTPDVPEPRPEPIPAGTTLPYDKPFDIARHLSLKMESGHYMQFARIVVTTDCWDKAGVAPSFDLLDGMLETAAERDADKLLPLLRKYLSHIEADQPQD